MVWVVGIWRNILTVKTIKLYMVFMFPRWRNTCPVSNKSGKHKHQSLILNVSNKILNWRMHFFPRNCNIYIHELVTELVLAPRSGSKWMIFSKSHKTHRNIVIGWKEQLHLHLLFSWPSFVVCVCCTRSTFHVKDCNNLIQKVVFLTLKEENNDTCVLTYLFQSNNWAEKQIETSNIFYFNCEKQKNYQQPLLIGAFFTNDS